MFTQYTSLFTTCTESCSITSNHLVTLVTTYIQQYLFYCSPWVNCSKKSLVENTHLITMKAGNKAKYNMFGVYDLLKLDKEKLFSVHGNRTHDPCVLAELNKTLSYYSDQIKNEFNEFVNPRYFTWFHFIPSEDRSAFMINNSYLTEAFDVHACSFVVMSKLLEKINYAEFTDNEDDIKAWYKELYEFQNVCKNKYIYQEIADHFGLDLAANKKVIKQAAQTWLNMLDSDLHKTLNSKYIESTDPGFYYALFAVNSYFESNFPLITSVFNAWETEPKKKQSKLGKKIWDATNVIDRQVLVNKLTAKEKKKVEYSKTIWKEFQRVELNTISKKMCNYLFFTYGVLPVTVHDALYLSENDLNFVSQYENIENIFWNLIDLKYFPEERIYKKQYVKSINNKGVMIKKDYNYLYIINEKKKKDKVKIHHRSLFIFNLFDVKLNKTEKDNYPVGVRLTFF